MLDVSSRELRSSTGTVLLQTQPFEILRLLLARAGQVVLREELRRRLWPDGTFVDYEHSLNAAVKRLRHALGDDADQPRFVETIPRRGYRFVAPVFDRLAADVRPAAAAASTVCARLAVLPVAHLGADDQFAEGLTEELRTQLARLSGGVVAILARSSSMLFGEEPRRASEMGEALRVDYLLEGSVRSDGARLRTSVWLIETVSETQVWGETVECHRAGAISAQVEVATRLAEALIERLVTLA